MNIKRISLISLFIALSVAGASIKIPAIVSSVALDMVPALLAGVILGGGPGALIALLGHLLSAFIGGMPLGPFHFMIAVEMALLVWLFAIVYRKGKRVIASILFVLGNTFVAPLPFLFLMGSGVLYRDDPVIADWFCIEYRISAYFSTALDCLFCRALS